MLRQTERKAPVAGITDQDARAILRLRLLIARAANRDSLVWWDDDSLTLPAGFVLERLFPGVPPLTARSLAIHAAVARYVAAFSSVPSALHLYRLDSDNLDGLALRFFPLLTVPVNAEPIASMDELRSRLLALCGQPMPYRVLDLRSNGNLEIEIPPCPAGGQPLLHRAQTLAWAYLAGAKEKPVFPFLEI